MSIQRYIEVLRKKVKPPMAILLGAPGEVCALLDHLRFEGTVCYQMDLYPADRLRDSLAEQNLAAELVAGAAAGDVSCNFSRVIYIASQTGGGGLKLDICLQGFYLCLPGRESYVPSPYYTP